MNAGATLSNSKTVHIAAENIRETTALYNTYGEVSEWVEFNAPPDTIQVN